MWYNPTHVQPVARAGNWESDPDRARTEAMESIGTCEAIGSHTGHRISY
jgi:hypothetical protein